MKAIKASAHDHTHSALREFLRGLPLFYHLSEDEIAHFANYAHIKIYRKGQSLYREGESSLHFFCYFERLGQAFTCHARRRAGRCRHADKK